jgi:hypothetical protein
MRECAACLQIEEGWVVIFLAPACRACRRCLPFDAAASAAEGKPRSVVRGRGCRLLRRTVPTGKYSLVSSSLKLLLALLAQYQITTAREKLQIYHFPEKFHPKIAPKSLLHPLRSGSVITPDLRQSKNLSMLIIFAGVFFCMQRTLREQGTLSKE